MMGVDANYMHLVVTKVGRDVAPAPAPVPVPAPAPARERDVAGAWAMLLDPSKVKAGQQQTLAALLDDLGVEALEQLKVVDGEDVASIAALLKKAHGKSFLTKMATV